MKNKNSLKKEILILQNKVYKISILCCILCFFIIIFGYIIMFSDFLYPKIDEKKMSYLSFYNKTETDMIRINDIKKMSNSKGKSNLNNNYQEFQIIGKKGLDYEVVLYSLKNDIPNKYVMFSFYNQNDTFVNSIDLLSDSVDGGKILYSGKVNKKNNILRMWVSDKYKKKIGDTSFEIKIRKK